jgi:SAM-dependent MidA family methyltransferase
MNNAFNSQRKRNSQISTVSSDNELLKSLIVETISHTPNQRITFAEYMDLVLYHPEQGYYATGAVNIGSEGDFFTSPHLANDFGELLAEQFAEMWEILGCPSPFTLVEMGAGQGLLAADLLGYLQRRHPDCFEVLEYIIIEKSAGLIVQQQRFLEKFKFPVRWSSLEEIAENSITGCFFSNELVDALPVHQVVVEDRQLQEVYVTISNTVDGINFGEFIDALSTPQLSQYFDFVGIDLTSGAYQNGYRTEVNLAALEWLNTVANRLHQGFLLTIDYGYPAARYYQSARDQGTLQCYLQHQHHDNPYLYVGHQDITAHVDFTALERQGELSGLRNVGFTQQGLFLMALGLGDRLTALSCYDSSRGEVDASAKDVMVIMQRREALHQLINPMGIGGFGVLIQSKGLDFESRKTLKGLIVPPMF